MEDSYFTIVWWFLPYINMNQPWVHMCLPSWTPLPPPSSLHPSELSQNSGFECPASCIDLYWSYVTYGNIRVSMLFSQIIPLAFSHRVQKSVLYICVSFAALHTGSSLHIWLKELSYIFPDVACSYCANWWHQKLVNSFLLLFARHLWHMSLSLPQASGAWLIGALFC